MNSNMNKEKLNWREVCGRAKAASSYLLRGHFVPGLKYGTFHTACHWIPQNSSVFIPTI